MQRRVAVITGVDWASVGQSSLPLKRHGAGGFDHVATSMHAIPLKGLGGREAVDAA